MLSSFFRSAFTLHHAPTHRSGARAAPQNIGRADRILRLVLAIALFVLAITTNWSPILIFFSGFALFEAIFSWCGFYAAIGKNTCGIA